MRSTRHSGIHIGTSGWHYEHWKGPFYPEDLPPSRMLEFYANVFDTVEINNTFYRLPSEATFKDWRDTTQKHFCFSVKASRFITHMKKLNDPEAALNKFLPSIKMLGNKLGPILFQLPPRWHLNLDRFSVFLKALPSGHDYTFEFRDTTWHCADVYELMKRRNIAFCIYDLAGVQSPLGITADFAYVRLHGPKGPYQGPYTKKVLAGWARRIRQWEKSLKAVHIYFDNDQAGYAVQNARELIAMI